MKSRLFSLLCLFNLSSYAQEEQQVLIPAKNRHFYSGIQVSGLNCYRVLSQGKSQYDLQGLIALRDEIEVPKWSYAFALTSGYKFNRHIGLELGVGLTNRGYLIEDLSITTIDNPEGTGEFVDVKWHDYYIDIPLRFNLTFGKKSLRFLTGTSITTGFLLTETQQVINSTIIADKTTTSPYIDLYRKINVFPSVFVGIEWQFTQRMLLRIETGFQYGLIKLSETPIETRLYNTAINVSYLVRL